MFFKLIFLCLLSFQSYAVSLDELLDRLDKVYRSETSIADMTMTIKTPHWERSLKLKAWTQGLEKTFISILEPSKDKGISTLKRGNEMWNYFPKINKVIKIPPSMMMGSWMGSDFTNDDLVKENTYREDYNSKFGDGDAKRYLIILTPKKETVTVWGKIEVWVDKKLQLPLEQIYYDEKNEKIRVMKFSEIKKLSGKTIPTKMILTSLKKKGHQTIVIYNDIEFNKSLDDDIFTRKNLQKRR